MEKKICVLAIIVENREENAPKVNEVLGRFSDSVYGRLGIPIREKNSNVISVILEATNDEIGSVSGKLGNIPGVKVKTVSI
ncbi:MAG: CopG family transcriptional regulator [Alphaproteobacteria bacterium]|nr:CopG family transcriptional regulator [Alphaproteobacteria bacterium]